MTVLVPTGLEFLDRLLGGGLPLGASVILQGPAGEEKEAIAWRFLEEGWASGEAAVVVLSSMSPRKFREILEARGVDVRACIAANRLFIVDWFSYREQGVTDVQDEGTVLRASVDLTNVGVAITWALNRLPEGRGVRAVLEVISPALNAYDQREVFRFMQVTKAKLENRDVTALFLVETGMHDPSTLSSIHQPFDGVIDIERVREGDRLVRKVGVPSIRGMAPVAEYVPFDLEGPILIPHPEADRAKAKREVPSDYGLIAPSATAELAEPGEASTPDETADGTVPAATDETVMAEPSPSGAPGTPAEGHGPTESPSPAHMCPACGATLGEAAELCYACGSDLPHIASLMEALETRLLQEPKDLDALFIRAAGLARLEHWGEAAQALNEVARLEPAYPGLWLLKATVYENLGKPDIAESCRARAEVYDRERVIEAPTLKVAEAWREEVTGPPTEEAVEAPTLEVAEALREEVIEPPTEEVAEPLMEEVVEALREEVAEALEKEAAEAPTVEAAKALTDVAEAPAEAAPSPAVSPPAAEELPAPLRTVEAGPKRSLTSAIDEEKVVGEPAPGGTLIATDRRLLEMRPRDRVPGRTIGPQGHVNGLVNGKGRTNGLVNGKGRTNGLVNGKGRTNGLVNGKGRTNGLVNGMWAARAALADGLTNGSGFTNGLGSLRFYQENHSQKWPLYIVPLVAAVLLVTPLLLPPQGDGYPIHIDGAFDDWAASMVVDSTPNPQLNPSVDIIRFGVADNLHFLATYVEVVGPALAGGGASQGVMDTVRVFLDVDSDPATGYRVDGLGSERMLELEGAGGIVHGARMWEFDPSRDVRDWGGWTRPIPASAAVGGSKIEAQVEWHAFDSGPVPIVAIARTHSWDGKTDAADAPLGPDRGTLLIAEESLAPQLLSGPNVPLLRVTATAVQATASFDSLTVRILGTAPEGSATTLRLLDSAGQTLSDGIRAGRHVRFDFPLQSIAPGSTVTLSVVGDFTGGSGETFGLRMSGGPEAVRTDGIVSIRTVSTPRSVGYVGPPPAGPDVDGGFAEWTSLLTDSGTEPGLRGNVDIDLRSYGALRGGSSLFLYADVAGRMFAGTPVPQPPLLVPAPGAAAPDGDRDTVPDDIDPMRFDFNNDGTPDSATNGDVDGDGIADYGVPGGSDLWLNTTLPASFPPPYAGRSVNVYVGPTNRPVVIGDDVLRAFFDVDNNTWSGYAIGGVGADRMVEVHGKDGEVTQSAVLSFAGSFPGDWSWRPLSPVTLATSPRAIEMSVGFDALAVVLEVGDFWGGADTTAAGGGRAPTAPSVQAVSPTNALPISFAVSPATTPLAVPWQPTGPAPMAIVIDPGSNAVTTQYNHQRKVVRAGDASPDTDCDATNSDGCWYAVFYDQLSEAASTTAASTETPTKGSPVGGTFPGSISSEDADYRQYQEGVEVPRAEIGYRSATSSGVNFPKTRTWDGTAWGGETEQATSGSPVRFVRMAWSPTTLNERIVVTLSDDGWLDAYVCTPTCTVTNNIGQVWSTAPTAPDDQGIRFDVAYEYSSGAALLVYHKQGGTASQDIAYKTYSGGAWGGEQYLDDSGHTGAHVEYSLIKLASRTDSDQIGLIGAERTNVDVNAWIWDGSAWPSSAFTEITGTPEGATQEQVAIAWETNSGDLLAVGAEAGQIRSKQYTTSWSASVTFAFGGINPMEWISLKPNPVGNDMVIMATGAADDMGTAYWTGSAWANGNNHDVDPNGGGREADFAWEPTGSKGLLVWGDDAGLISRKTFTAPNTWGSQTNVAMGTGTHPWVQLRTRSSSTGATLILGAVLETTANDLGGIKWDGSTFTVIGASTFTADTGTSTYESFELEYRVVSGYELEVQHDFSAVPAGDSYTLKVKGYRDDENVAVQVLNPGPTWTTRITISATSNTLYTYTLTTDEYDSGTPSIRFVDAGVDGSQSNVFVDLSVVTSNTHWDRVILRRSSDTSGSTPWGTPIVLASGKTGEGLLLERDSTEPSIAIDSGGVLHVVWAAADAAGNQAVMDRIRYTKTNAAYPIQSEIDSVGDWTTVEIVNVTATGGFMPTISTDSNNAPHVAWSGSKTSGTVYYRNKVGGAWKPTVSWGTTYTGLSVDVSPTTDNYVSLARFYDAATDEIQYTVCKTLASSDCDLDTEFTRWDETAGADQVVTAPEVGSYPSLAHNYDATEDVWVAYAKDVGADRAIYARFLDYPAGWQTAETVASTGGTIFTKPSIGIDKDNNVHAFYVATSGPQLYYKKRAGGSWGTATAIDTTSDNPTLMVRAPNHATWGTTTGGLYWKTSTSETYFYVPEFELIVAPILIVALLGIVHAGRGRRRRSVWAAALRILANQREETQICLATGDEAASR